MVLDTGSNLDGTNNTNQATWSWGGISAQSFRADFGNSRTSSTVSVHIFEPKLGIEKSSLTSIAIPGNDVTFRVKIFHTSTSHIDAHDVKVSDFIPSGLTFTGTPLLISGEPWSSWNYQPTTKKLVIVWDTLQVSQSAVIEFRTTVGSPKPGAIISNSAAVEWSTLLGDFSQPIIPMNNASTERWYDPAIQVDIYNASSSTSLTVPILPGTGFAPDRVTQLLAQPVDNYYSTLGEVWMEIPDLKISLPILGIPVTNSGWDVSWLSIRQAGWKTLLSQRIMGIL